MVSSNSYTYSVKVKEGTSDRRIKPDKVCHNITDFGKMPFGKHCVYGHEWDNHVNLSLSCPIVSCKFVGFSKILDYYDEKRRQLLLTSSNKHAAATNIKFQWVDWYVTKKITKRLMIFLLVTHFGRIQPLDQYLDLMFQMNIMLLYYLYCGRSTFKNELTKIDKTCQFFKHS